MDNDEKVDLPVTRAEYWSTRTDDGTIVGIPDDWTPTIDDRTRTTAYFVAGVGIPVVGFGAALATIWFPENAGNIAATAIALDTLIGTIAGVFGIVNRPTKYPVVK